MARIMIVDVKPSVREALAMVLEIDGHEVAVAATAQAALDRAAAFRPDVMLVDPHLPDMSLAAFCAALGGICTTPVVVMSLHPADRTQAEASGAAAFLAKPFAPAELIATLRRCTSLSICR
jgi:DNA-binding response OmpR family regulator